MEDLAVDVGTASTSVADAGVHAASAGDVRALTDTMLDAFDDDPLYRWLAADADRRRPLLSAMFGLVLARGLERGLVLCNEARTGVAVWTPPGAELLDEAAVGTFVDLLARYAPHRQRAALAGMAACEHHRPVGPHWVLHSLAVATGAQGAGWGTRLLSAGLAPVDADGAPTALDSSNERNLSLYRRAGFDVVAEVPLEDGPVMRPMIRPA